MAVKRFAELRFLGKTKAAGWYRRSFRYYDDEKLITSSFFYALTSTFFLGVFLIKYRVEFLLSMPFLAGLFTWYLKLGFKANSPAQYPEKLYKERAFLFYCLLLAALLMILALWPVHSMQWFLKNSFITQ